jgi:hypothetical protein
VLATGEHSCLSSRESRAWNDIDFCPLPLPYPIIYHEHVLDLRLGSTGVGDIWKLARRRCVAGGRLLLEPDAKMTPDWSSTGYFTNKYVALHRRSTSEGNTLHFLHLMGYTKRELRHLP